METEDLSVPEIPSKENTNPIRTASSKKNKGSKKQKQITMLVLSPFFTAVLLLLLDVFVLVIHCTSLVSHEK